MRFLKLPTLYADGSKSSIVNEQSTQLVLLTGDDRRNKRLKWFLLMPGFALLVIIFFYLPELIDPVITGFLLIAFLMAAGIVSILLSIYASKVVFRLDARKVLGKKWELGFDEVVALFVTDERPKDSFKARISSAPKFRIGMLSLRSDPMHAKSIEALVKAHNNPDQEESLNVSQELAALLPVVRQQGRALAENHSHDTILVAAEQLAQVLSVPILEFSGPPRLILPNEVDDPLYQTLAETGADCPHPGPPPEGMTEERGNSGPTFAFDVPWLFFPVGMLVLAGCIGLMHMAHPEHGTINLIMLIVLEGAAFIGMLHAILFKHRIHLNPNHLFYNARIPFLRGREIPWADLKRVEIEHSPSGTSLHMFTSGKRLVVHMSAENCEWFKDRLEHYLVDELRLARKK